MSLRSVSTSTSRPQGKKLLFALLHSERNTEEPTNGAGGQKLDAELVCLSREHHSQVDVKSLLAELQLKNKELERMHTDVAERDITISKLQADLAARETTLREMQASASNCRLLLEALETGLTTCQNMFGRMQTKAKDIAHEIEELHTRNKDTFRQKLDKPEEHDLFGIRNPNSSVRSSHLLLRNAHR